MGTNISQPTTTIIMMKLAIFIGVLATCALSASVVDYKKRGDNLELQKRGNNTDNSTDCFVCPENEAYAPCWPMHWLCDGYKDCASGFDESPLNCRERERNLMNVIEDIGENAQIILSRIAYELVTDDYDFLEDVYEETRDAAEKINDVIEESMEEFH